MANDNDAFNPNAAENVQPVELYRYVVCSTAHLTEQDAALFCRLGHQRCEWGDAEWIHLTGTGYLVRLSAYSFPLLVLKKRGFSKSARKLVYVLMRRFDVSLIHFDCCGEVLKGVAVHGA
ncbi:DUF5983 family protein [Yersinia bercovieri]|uniref:DUF5983 family protein n=1 Tax=Yersinia bercovieri TaxID=634 RepID=UPI001CFE4811|nr:DUF5983 family protein [Yersinia bercovieri]MCB5301826.1 DUF5983 family protein [Yersinia bercovieri]